MDVLMPQLGETVAEGRISAWFKAVGETVAPGDTLFEVETDKTAMEVPATEAGVLSAIRVETGAVAPVGAVVAVIGAAGGPAAPAQATKPPAAPLDPFREVRMPERGFGPARLASGAFATPLARRLAAEAGLDPARLTGSGPHGRLVARDVAAALAATAAAPGASAASVKAHYDADGYEEVPLDPMRATIARRMTELKQAVPHFYLTADVELGALLALREQANRSAPQGKDGEPAFKLSVNDFVIKGLALALQRVPAANAAFAGDRLLRFRHSDIGVAVAVEGGLFTPVIRRAEAKSLSVLSAEARDLAARARERRLRPEEYRGGSSAVSNLGMLGVREFAAIINPPQATILAVGTAQRRPRETASGGVAFASEITVTLSCDHRVLDGATGAELLAAFKGLLENPLALLI